MCVVSSVSTESEAGGGCCSAEPALWSSSAGGMDSSQSLPTRHTPRLPRGGWDSEGEAGLSAP